MRLPEQRQYRCVFVNRDDGMALRELVPPQPFDPAAPAYSFAAKLYEALLRLWQDEGLDGFNVAVSPQEAMWINFALKHDSWRGALGVLAQTWQVLHEWNYDSPVRYRTPLEAGEYVEAKSPPGVEGSVA